MSVLKYRAAIGAGADASTTERLVNVFVIVNPPRCSAPMTRALSASVGVK